MYEHVDEIGSPFANVGCHAGFADEAPQELTYEPDPYAGCDSEEAAIMQEQRIAEQAIFNRFPNASLVTWTREGSSSRWRDGTQGAARSRWFCTIVGPIDNFPTTCGSGASPSEAATKAVEELVVRLAASEPALCA